MSNFFDNIWDYWNYFDCKNCIDENKQVIKSSNSGDTLVIKLEDLYSKCYIFYDYKNELFGIRMTITNSFSKKDNSYYCDNKEVLITFLLEQFSDYKNTSIYLYTYKNLPLDSDNITCNMLSDYEDTSNEIMSFEYDLKMKNNDYDEDEDEEKYDVEKYPEEKLRSFMNMIEHMYNEY